MPPRKPKASAPQLQQQKLLLPDGSSTRSGKASGAAAAPPRDPGAAPPVRRSIQKTGGHRADARRLRWEEPPAGTEPAGTTANLWSFSDGMVRQLFRKNGVLRVDSKLMPDVKFELHEMVQALVNDIHAVAFADDPERPRVAGDVESRVITSKHVEQVLKRLGMRVWMPPLEDAAERRSRNAGRDGGDAGEEDQGEGDQGGGDQDDGDLFEDGGAAPDAWSQSGFPDSDQGDGERGDGGVGDEGAGAPSIG